MSQLNHHAWKFLKTMSPLSFAHAGNLLVTRLHSSRNREDLESPVLHLNGTIGCLRLDTKLRNRGESA